MRKLLVILALSMVLAACAAQPTGELPTAAPTAASLDDLVAVTGLPPTRDLRPQEATLAQPTRPTATSRPTATPVDAALSIVSPDEGAPLVLGTEVDVSGLLQSQPGQQVQVSLLSLTGQELATVDGTIDANTWRATLAVPEFVTGAGRLRARLLDESANPIVEAFLPVALEVDPERTSTYLIMNRPDAGELAVAAHNLYYNGFLQRYGGGFLRVTVWMDDCQRKVAEYGFSLRGTTPWEAFLIVPRGVSGLGCAVASVGEPGDEFWRAAQVPITVMDQEAEDAYGVTILGPEEGEELLSGDTVLVYGLAFNAPQDEVNLSIVLDNGRILTESIIETDTWGYWEQSIVLPYEIEGQANITASAGDPDEPLVTDNVLVNIVPGAPPPTLALPTSIFTPTPEVTPTPDS